MKEEALLYLETEEFIYPVSRKCLCVRFRAAKGDLARCSVIFYDRTDRSKQRYGILERKYRDRLFDYYSARVSFPKIARYQTYYFCLEDTDHEIRYLGRSGLQKEPPVEDCFEYLYTNETDVVTTPSWAEGMVCYQIFPERFCNGDPSNDPEGTQVWGSPPTRENYCGGDLKGIREKIPYLKDLGIDCIYINPIFKGDFNHKYATTDYFAIDPSFGTEQDLKDLTDAAHRVGIRILLDGVFNHTGVHFAPFEDLLEHQESSQYRDWFHVPSFPLRVSHHSYECVGAYKWMPKLNTANPEVRSFVIRVMTYWIEHCGIDGWRLDVADEVDGCLWREARYELKRRYPDVFLVGETWGYGGRLLRGDQLDSVMNYLFRDAVAAFIGKRTIPPSEFDVRLNHMLALYKEENDRVLYNLIGSHDTERFLTLCGGDRERLKLAAAFQMTFPGIPAIYYGDEAGLTGENDPGCRGCMNWTDPDRDLTEWYRRLIRLRHEMPELQKGSFHSWIADDERQIYGFTRRTPESICYVLFHLGQAEHTVPCPVEEEGIYRNTLGREIYLTERGKTGYRIHVLLEPDSVKVITNKEEKDK